MRERPNIIVEVLVALVTVLLAWAIRLVFAPLLGERLPFITFFPAMFAVAWWGGLRATIIATTLSVGVLLFFILEPGHSLSIRAIEVVEYRYGLGIFVAVALATGWMGERMHAARWDALQAKSSALKDSEQLRVTLASIGDAVIVADSQGRVVLLNPIAEKLTGWTRERAAGQPLSAVYCIVDEDTRQPLEDPCAKVLRTGVIANLAHHTVLVSKNENEVPIDDSAAPIRDAAGTIQGVVVVFRDVTERRFYDRSLRQSERELSDFFDNAAIPVHSEGPDGIILQANQAELDMLGYERDEFVGHHIAEFHIDRQAIDELLVRLSRGEVVQNFEACLRCKNGTAKHVMITSSVFWEEGRFVHTRCFTRDVTDRKLAEDALAFLARASAALAALVDRESALQQSARIAIPYLADWCVVYVVDEYGEIDYHAHAHYDADKERLLTKMLTASPLDWNSSTATVRALRTGEPQLMSELPEAFLDDIAQSDEHRDIIRELGPRAVISVPLRIRDRIVGVMGLVSCDLARRYSERELKLAEALAERVSIAVENSKLFHAVKEANRQKDEFLAMLAHELRNPLAAIRYAVTLGTMSNGDSTHELFEIIDRQTHSLANLIDDLLDVSRISGDKVTLRKESIETATLIQRAVATVRPLVEQKRHHLALEISDEPMVLFVDPTRAEQILANLLTNAAKYTPDEGHVTVRARRAGDEIAIEVSDSGVGLPAEMLSRVFDLFTQADRTLDRSEGGLGIGLTVAKKLTEMHGGTLSAASEGPGKGATFTLCLPIGNVAPATVQSPSLESDGAMPERLRVLVVDDNRDTATSCSMLLRTLGHEVETAYDGPSALQEARSFRPQIMFLDIGLPGMNGYDVARTLREEGFQNELIVAVSGYGQPEDRRRSREAGFSLHLVKPVDQAAILSTLRSARDTLAAVP